MTERRLSEIERTGPALRVLVTGASGLLGGTLVGHLVGRGHGVLAMLGRKPAPPGWAGMAEAWSGSSPAPGRVATLSADLRQDELGLGAAALHAIASGVDLIIHCAAVTGFGLPPAAYRQVNVEGTARILALAEGAGPAPVPLLQVSTAYVCGERSGPIPEAPPAPGTRFANGYEASKAEAERLVAAARGRGLPTAVARPSIVVGAWADGAIARFDNLYGVIRLVTEGRIRSIPADPAATLDLVPIDHVVQGLADIAERMERAAGRIFHLVSGVPVPVARLRELALSYPQFHAPRFVPAGDFEPAALDEEEAWWHGRVTDPYASYFLRDPRFIDAHLRALSGRACPPVDWAYLRRMIDRCIAEGFLRGTEEVQRTSG
ncbi:SDR family oxidoreductase [Roseomonas sp. SSH11]|uniref:SDR family oxidoreductase n=1 Tax=Pararoseomonas baculiformis TaxID=2820812 RepID=A0ABS4AAE9_9PROT|nr:SDR family oxidoreductase [Pararoseomonas baculiformis]MBP0443831.1 SDR family oxidoreductase [Pararoseomonas baculiformis]